MSGSFQDELNYLRDVAKEFASRNTKLEKYFGASSTDPDVEHLMEGFAFLTSRLRDKIEDEMPEITHGILDMVWPQFLRPFPPTAMLKFTPQDKAITARQIVPRGTGVFAEKEGETVTFHSTSDVTVYPLEIGNVGLERSRDRSILTLDFATLSSLPLADIGLDDLRLWFRGEAAAELYTWSLTRTRRIVVRATGTDYWRDLHLVEAGGFGPQDALIDKPLPLFDGYRLLQEYFLFKEKFTCLDIPGLAKIFNRMPGREFTLSFEYEGLFPPDIKIANDAAQLYCTPVQNLFRRLAEAVSTGNDLPRPIRSLGAAGAAQPAPPEIYAIERVAGGGKCVYPPFEAFEHEIETATDRNAVYYRHLRAPALSGGWQHSIAFVDHAGERVIPPDPQIGVQLLCFDGGKAPRLGPGSICHGLHDMPSFVSCANVTAPCAPVYPPLDDAVLWQFISNFSPHYFTLRSREAFAGMVTIYDYIAARDRVAERGAKRRADAILAIDARPIDWLFKGKPLRGLQSSLTLSGKAFASEGDLYLFATVLSRFMAVFATTNSFHKLDVLVSETGRRFQWEAAQGLQPLI